MTQHRILFVSERNMCRSPLAEGAMRRLIAQEDRLDDFLLDSAGSSVCAGQEGLAPAAQAIAAARAEGFDMSGRRSRQIRADDFRNFDLLLTMDGNGRDALKSMAPERAMPRVHRLLDFSPWLSQRDIAALTVADSGGLMSTLDLMLLALRGLLVALDQSACAPSQPVWPRDRAMVSSSR